MSSSSSPRLYLVPDTPDPESTLHASIFLAGPCPRDSGVTDWRHDCVELFKQKGFTGALFWPVPNSKEDHGSFNLDKQVAWETKHLKMADLILFWIPRKIDGAFAGLTTNVEFGLYHKSGKCVMGYPPEAEKMKYIQWWCEKIDCLPVAQTLPELVDLCLAKLKDLGYHTTTAPKTQQQGEGENDDSKNNNKNDLVARRGGEHYVPLILWRSQAFQDWYQNQLRHGNKLLWADVEYVFTLKRSAKFTFSSAFIAVLKAHIQIASENNRVKENEVVIFRPDVSAVVPFFVDDDGPASEEDENTTSLSSSSRLLPSSTLFKSIKVVLTSEFRTPCRNAAGNQVVEPPCGSSWDHVDYIKNPDQEEDATATEQQQQLERNRKIALEELHEEADILLTSEEASSRLIYVGSRQIASTLSAHKSHVFAVQLTRGEFDRCLEAERESKVFGVEEDTERTSIRILSFEDVLSNSDNGLDWSAVGVISQTLMKAMKLF